MKSQLNIVLAALPALSPDDLAKVKATVNRLGSSGKASPLYEALTNVIGTKMPFSRFVETTTYKVWETSEWAFLDFMDQTWPNMTKRLEREISMHFLLGLLAADLKRMNVKVSMGAMTLNMINIPAVFERAFPGYRKSGLANMVRPKVRK